MNSNYAFLCVLMWCRYGQQEAGSELMRAAQEEALQHLEFGRELWCS